MNAIEYGFVVHCKRRGGYASDARPVGLSEVANARFFTEARHAELVAFWQQGLPVPAMRKNGRIFLLP
jgi:hypothetical protein